MAGFPPARRLHRPADFRRVYAQGRRFGNDCFTVNAVASATGPRLGLSIAARVLKRAVARNRVRRLVRESFRAHQQRLPPVDIVIGVRSVVAQTDNARLRATLERLWDKLAAADWPPPQA